MVINIEYNPILAQTIIPVAVMGIREHNRVRLSYGIEKPQAFYVIFYITAKKQYMNWL